MIDVRLTATNPEDSTLVPVPCNERGELLTVAPKIEKIPNDVVIDGALTVTGLINGSDGVGEQGPQGEQGEQGEPGPNVLLPYGPEASYLAIKEGVPTWVFSGGGGGGPVPDHELTVLDTRSESVTDCKDFGSWNAQGYLVDPPDPWDTYIRTLPTWDTPAAQKTGIGGTNAEEGGTRFPFTLTLRGGFDKLLQLSIAYRQYQPNDGGRYDRRTLSVTTDNDQLTPIDDGFQIEKFPGGDYQDVYTCVFLPQRPDIGTVTFNLVCTIKDIGTDKSITYAFVQRWEYVDPSKYLLNRIIKAKNELITTTDIDISRPTQD